MGKTTIEWTESSWNPLRARDHDFEANGWHCEIITPGCENCYAQAINRRVGTGWPYLRTSRDRVRVLLHEKTLEQPLHWKEPRRIFVCSMSDLFGGWVPLDTLVRIFRVMADAPQHTYQILTKRHERQRDFMRLWVIEHGDQLPPNWWLGVSVEDQRRADERIPVLLETPAAVRWVSVEPQLEHVDLHLMDDYIGDPGVVFQSCHSGRLSWVVCGGESGHGARPFNIEWARSIIAQCKAAGVPCFVKQLGARPYIDPFRGTNFVLTDRKGGNPAEWCEDLRVREYPR